MCRPILAKNNFIINAIQDVKVNKFPLCFFKMARKVASKPPLASKTSHHDPLSREKLPNQPKPSADMARQGNNPTITVDAVPNEEMPDHDLPKEGAAHDDTIEMSFQIRMQERKHNEEVGSIFFSNIFFSQKVIYFVQRTMSFVSYVTLLDTEDQ